MTVHVLVLWPVACLHPHNSISNVVVSLMIHDNIYKFFRNIFIYLQIHVNVYVNVNVYVHV